MLSKEHTGCVRVLRLKSECNISDGKTRRRLITEADLADIARWRSPRPLKVMVGNAALATACLLLGLVAHHVVDDGHAYGVTGDVHHGPHAVEEPLDGQAEADEHVDRRRELHLCGLDHDQESGDPGGRDGRGADGHERADHGDDELAAERDGLRGYIGNPQNHDRPLQRGSIHVHGAADRADEIHHLLRKTSIQACLDRRGQRRCRGAGAEGGDPHLRHDREEPERVLPREVHVDGRVETEDVAGLAGHAHDEELADADEHRPEVVRLRDGARHQGADANGCKHNDLPDHHDQRREASVEELDDRPALLGLPEHGSEENREGDDAKQLGLEESLQDVVGHEFSAKIEQRADNGQLLSAPSQSGSRRRRSACKRHGREHPLEEVEEQNASFQ
mmetsp:Transcript_73786/g.240354  ORF Transcript_73786/g.240354 Transcript_73786/m.240354 type:complete len:392 (+) Transcript_73786:74-1249(+)